MEKIVYICENDNLKENLKRLENMGYKYIVKVNDTLLSGWGLSHGKKHIQLIACYDEKERQLVYKDLKHDDTLNYINWYYINDYKGIYSATYNKTFTIRNDWTRTDGYIAKYLDKVVG